MASSAGPNVRQKDFTEGLLATLKPWIWGLLAFGLAVNLLMLTVPLFMLQVYDRVLPSQSRETLVYLLLIAIFALTALGLLDYARGALLRRLGFWFEDAFGSKAMERAIWSRLIGGTYDVQSQSDLATVRQVTTTNSLLALFDLPFSPIFVVCLFLLHPALGFTTLAAALLLAGLAFAHSNTARHRSDTEVRSATEHQGHIRSLVTNARAIDAMGMTKGLVGDWQKSRASSLDTQQIATDRSSRYANTAKAIRLVLQAGILAIGAYYVIEGELSPGGIIAGSILMGRALQPIDQSILGWQQVVNAWKAFERLSMFLSTPDLRPATFSLPAPVGALQVDNVSYAYRNARTPALQDISFSVPAGSTLVILGRSGSGKSTLADLLSGVLKPQQGRTNLDGHEIFSWPREEFANHFGYVPQQVELISGTVEENISRFHAGDADSVHAAAEAAGITDLIAALPQGYETPIGPSGHFLSAGQRQRIALARALYVNPSFVVLDEPDSNLDMEGQQALMAGLGSLKAHGATTVIISHRQGLIDFADYLLILHQGRIEAFGPKDEVLQKLRANQPRLQS